MSNIPQMHTCQPYLPILHSNIHGGWLMRGIHPPMLQLQQRIQITTMAFVIVVIVDQWPGDEIPCINRESKLMPTKDPPYTANTAMGSFSNNEPSSPTTELARTGSAAAESSLDSRKNMVAIAPRILKPIIKNSIGSPRMLPLVPMAPPPPLLRSRTLLLLRRNPLLAAATMLMPLYFANTDVAMNAVTGTAKCRLAQSSI